MKKKIRYVKKSIKLKIKLFIFLRILINSFFDFSNYFFHFPYQRKPNFIKNKIRLPHFKITLINSCYTS